MGFEHRDPGWSSSWSVRRTLACTLWPQVNSLTKCQAYLFIYFSCEADQRSPLSLPLHSPSCLYARPRSTYNVQRSRLVLRHFPSVYSTCPSVDMKNKIKEKVSGGRRSQCKHTDAKLIQPRPSERLGLIQFIKLLKSLGQNKCQGTRIT